MSMALLSLIVWHGMISACLMAWLRDCRQFWQRVAALICAGLGCVWVIAAQQAFQPTQGLQLVERLAWIPSMGVYYHLAMDGIALSMILLTTVIVLLCVLSICIMEEEGIAAACGWIFFVQAMCMGAFLAQDGLLFYLFWEASLLPMFLYIGLNGGSQRWLAARKYFLFTLFGSLFFLVSILYLGHKAGEFSLGAFYATTLTQTEQLALFMAFTLAFAIKLPMFPLHSWLPDAHTQASTAGSMLLAAILLKLGGYGFLRFNLPITPYASWYMAPAMVMLSIIAIIYIGFVAVAQTDVKRLIAYASISHMGMVTLGIFVIYCMPDTVKSTTQHIALSGIIVHMISHGLSAAGLFLGFGMMYQRIGSREVKDYGGLMRIMPIMSAFFMVFILSNIGFPGTAGFVGEFLVIFASSAASFWIALAAVSTMVLSAAYSLGLVKQVFYGRVINMELLSVMDVAWAEKGLLTVLCVLIAYVGIAPQGILSMTDHALKTLLEQSHYQLPTQ